MQGQTITNLARSTVDLPQDNPTRRLGQEIPAEGADGLFSQSWFPICLSAEVPRGTLRGETFLDGKVVVARGEDGAVRVMSAYCPHLGADLSIGQVVGNRIQCAFHEWEFGAYGECIKTAIGDRPPQRARLFKFPTQERYGIVWAFNGDTPLWEIPDFEFEDEELAVRVYRMPDYFHCDPWVFAANTPDMQHFKVVHKAEFSTADPHELVEWGEWGFRYPIVAYHQQGVPIEWKLGIRGTTIFWQEGPYGDFWLGGLVGFGLPAVGKHQVFAVLAVEKCAGAAADLETAQARLETAEALMYRTVGEDTANLNTIHYRPGTLTEGDRTLSRYLQFLRKYPRAHPSGPFIR